MYADSTQDRKNPMASPPDIEVHLGHDALPIDAAAVARLVRLVLDGEQRHGSAVSIAFVDDRAMTELNERYLGHQGPTDVLAFPLTDDEESAGVLGEVVVSLDTALRVAPEHGQDGLREALLYVVHGTLHLLGYDDHDPTERALMERRQQEYIEVFLREE